MSASPVSSHLRSPALAALWTTRASRAVCQLLLDIVRRTCPGALQPDPLDPGTVAPEVRVDPRTAQELFSTAALFTAGLLGDDGRPLGEAVLWAAPDRELRVEVARTRVRLAPGVVVVTIPVRCAEVGEADVHTTFAVGAPGRPVGMLAATEERPRGPDLVVRLWGEALVAFGWQVLLGVAAHVAFAAGADRDGQHLVPAALAADRAGLTVLPQARHGFDRVIRP